MKELYDILKKAGLEPHKISKTNESVLEGKIDELRIQEVKKEILKYFHECAEDKVSGKGKKIGELTNEGREFLSRLSGMEMKEIIDFRLNPSDMKHIFNDHYGKNEKDTGNNYALDDTDIMNLLDVITIPEQILYGIDKHNGNKSFFFFKCNEKGTYNLAEIYADKRGNLTAKSFYNTKKGISQRVMIIKDTLLPTSVTYFGESLSSTKMPKLFQLTKPERRIIADNIENNEGKALLMMDKEGRLYGYAIENSIYLTERGMNHETMIHEYTHIWCTAMKYGNSIGWQNIKDLLKETPLWSDVKDDPLYYDIKDDDDYVASEVLARVSGKENTVKYENILSNTKDKLKLENKPFKVNYLFNRIKKAAAILWTWVGKHMFDVKNFKSIDEITDRVLYDMLKSTKLEIGKPMLKEPFSKNSRFTDITVFKGKYGDPYIRCKIDGVQQMGIRVKDADLDDVWDNDKRMGLVEKYFAKALKEDNNRGLKI